MRVQVTKCKTQYQKPYFQEKPHIIALVDLKLIL